MESTWLRKQVPNGRLLGLGAFLAMGWTDGVVDGVGRMVVIAGCEGK